MNDQKLYFHTRWGLARIIMKIIDCTGYQWENHPDLGYVSYAKTVDGLEGSCYLVCAIVRIYDEGDFLIIQDIYI
jgi:hypothetical protein